MENDDLELPDAVVEAVLESGPSHHKREDDQVGRERAILPHPQAYERSYTESPMRRGGFLAGTGEIHTGPSTKTRTAPEPVLVRYPLEANESCRHCKSIELDEALRAHFNINVCESCRRSYGQEYYQMITKTTAREEFLLTDEELADKEHLPYMTKPNPHKSTWSDMHLYLLGDVRKFALSKWGSLEALQEELERRSLAKEVRKERKFKEKLADLRRKTRSAAIRKGINRTEGSSHKHTFQHETSSRKRCTTCGLEIDQEEI